MARTSEGALDAPADLDMNMTDTADPERLWRDLEARLRRYVRRRVPKPGDADDVTQEVFARMHAGLGSLGDAGRAPAWLFRIAANAIADHYREQARRASDAEEPDLPGDPEDPAAAARRELAACLDPLIARLPEPYREAVRLADLDELPQAEAAHRLGISLPAMKSRVQRGRQRLRELLTSCCRLEFDRRGQVIGYERRGPPLACSTSEDRPADCCERPPASHGLAAPGPGEPTP